MRRYLGRMAMLPRAHVAKITKIYSRRSDIVPTGAGLSIEQPAWDPKTKRFYTSIPIIANNPTGCNFGQMARRHYLRWRHARDRSIALHPTATQGAFDSATNTGVVPLNACGPNGATVGPHDNHYVGLHAGQQSKQHHHVGHQCDRRKLRQHWRVSLARMRSGSTVVTTVTI